MNSKIRSLGFVALSSLATIGLGGCSSSAASPTGETADGADEELRSGKAAITTFTGVDNQLYFHLKGGNGEIIVWSEGYVGQSGLDTGIASFKANASKTASYEIRDSGDGRAYFVIKAGNNEIIGRSQVYASKSNATRARDRAARLVTNIKISEAPRFARFETFKSLNDGQYYWHLRAGNGEIILASEGYATQAGADNGIASTKENGKTAGKFTIKTATSGEFYFVLQAGNNEIIGVSETYKAKASAEATRDRIVQLLGPNVATLQPNATAD